MELASSTISNLRSFLRRQDLLPDVNGGVVRLNLSRYGPSDLARQIDFVSFLMIAARIVLAIFVPAATFSTMVIRSLGSQRRRQSGSVICL